MAGRIYWYPSNDASLRTIVMDRAWRELVTANARSSTLARAGDGTRVQTSFAAARRLRAQAEYLMSLSVIREIEAVNLHLDRNKWIAIAEDDGCTWGGYARTPPAMGDASIRIDSQLWASWSTTTLGAGSTVVVQGASPKGLWEEVVVSSVSGTTVNFASSPLRFDYSDEPYVLVRDARFWPYLRKQDGAIGDVSLTTDRRISWRLDWQLEEHTAKIASNATRTDPFRGATGTGIGDWDAGVGGVGGSVTLLGS